MAPIKVYGSKLSSNAMRVFACLYEKDLDFEFVPVNMGAGDHKKEPFISLSPFGQVPAFEDGDLKLFESRAITKYISHTYADMGNQLIFQEPKKMAELLVWMEVEAHQFNSAAAKLGWELAFKPMFGLTTDDAAVEENLMKLGKVLDIYEARLSQSKYMVGNSFSLVDLHHLPNIKYLMDTRASEVFNSRPHVRAWCANIQARPAWKKVINM